jgi:hypothetical protein
MEQLPPCISPTMTCCLVCMRLVMHIHLCGLASASRDSINVLLERLLECLVCLAAGVDHRWQRSHLQSDSTANMTGPTRFHPITACVASMHDLRIGCSPIEDDSLFA